MAKYIGKYKGKVGTTHGDLYNGKIGYYKLEDIPIISLEITGNAEVVEGNTLQLGIEYTPSNTTQQGVIWSSSDETKATVDSNGLVTTISEGNVTITATSISNSSITDTHNINIEIPIISLTINGDTEVNRGNTLQLGIEYTPSNTTQQGVVWSSSDETKATVDSNGLVTGVSVGNVIITATSIINGVISDTHNITVNYVSNLYAVIKPFDLYPPTGYGIKEYNGWKYSAVNGSKNNDVPEHTFYWSDNSVAGRMRAFTTSEIRDIMGSGYDFRRHNTGILATLPVDKWYPDEFYKHIIDRCYNSTGEIPTDRPYGASGYKLYNLEAGTYKVKIWDVNFSNNSIGDGKFYKINGTTITPFTGNRFTNSSPDVHGTSTSKPQLKEVTVTIGIGEDINIITYNTAPTSTSSIGAAISAIELEKIVIPIENITINGTAHIEVGSSEQFTVTYNPLNTTEVGVVWSSSNESLATVDSNGLVTGVSAGDVTITATSTIIGAISDTYSLEIIPEVIEVIELISLTITGETEVVEGNTLQLGINYNPSNTTQTEVVWSSSDETKATVDSNGLVTLLEIGNVIITATSTINEAISDTHNFIITQPEVNLMGLWYLSEGVTEIYEGKIYQTNGHVNASATRTLYDTNTGSELPWRFMDDNEKIAAFGSTGKFDLSYSGSALQGTPWRSCSKAGFWHVDLKINGYYGINVPNGTYRIKILSSLDSSPYGGLLPTLGNILINDSNYLLPNVDVYNNTTWGNEQDYVVTDGKLLFKFLNNSYKVLGFSGINIKKIT